MKRAFVSVVGAALWGLNAVSESINDATKAFAISGALEGCIRTVSANPLGTTGSSGRVRRLGHLVQSFDCFWRVRHVFVFILAVTVSHISDNGTDHELTGIYFILMHIFIDDSVSRSVTADVLMGRSTKPSFLIWEEVYQKLSEVEDARWLCRATDLAMPRLESELAKHQTLSYVSGGCPFVCECLVM